MILWRAAREIGSRCHGLPAGADLRVPTPHVAVMPLHRSRARDVRPRQRTRPALPCRGKAGWTFREGQEALRRLPPDRQELLTLKYREDLNIIEIAVVRGIPAGTVKSRLYHAREQVRRILEGDES